MIPVNTDISVQLGNEVEYDPNNNEEEEEEGEQFDFDSGDEVPEADRGAPGAPEAGHVGAAAPSSGECPLAPRPQATSLTSRRKGPLGGPEGAGVR